MNSALCWNFREIGCVKFLLLLSEMEEKFQIKTPLTYKVSYRRNLPFLVGHKSLEKICTWFSWFFTYRNDYLDFLDFFWFSLWFLWFFQRRYKWFFRVIYPSAYPLLIKMFEKIIYRPSDFVDTTIEFPPPASFPCWFEAASERDSVIFDK